jgi:hypothetical protein
MMDVYEVVDRWDFCKGPSTLGLTLPSDADDEIWNCTKNSLSMCRSGMCMPVGERLPTAAQSRM